MTNSDVIYSQFSWESLSHKEQLSLMDEYFGNNSLYEATRLLKYYLGVWNENIRPLRSPVNRSVGFYVSKVAVGEPKIASANKSQAVVDAVSQILENSNFQTVKPLHVKAMSLYGDLFRKAVVVGGKPFHEMIETSSVTEFKEDTRGHMLSIRIDTPILVDDQQRFRTEYWTVEDNVPYVAVWEHMLNETTPLDQLGDPIQFTPLSRFGIDFVPIVRSPFRNDGGAWGSNACQHALLKVDEANRMATRLHQILYRFNKPTWAVSSNQVADDGSPIPAPKIKNATNTGKTDLEIRDDSILYLPGVSSIDSLIPDIKYDAALAILQSQEKELTKDLPELLFYDLPEAADLSGKAIRNMLGAAVDRATQAGSNFTEGTVRLNMMCMTLGQFDGAFSGLGEFDSGDLKHSLKFGDPFPMDALEKGQALQALTSGGLPLRAAMKELNFSDEEIDEAVAEKEKERQQAQANMLAQQSFRNSGE